MPKVSLIITVYNRANYLKAALESIRAQTYPHFELIILDDGSTDSSLAIAQNYAQKDSRASVISTPNQGQAEALIKAHEVANSEYLGWVDSDDLLAPLALQETVDILERFPNIGLVYTNYFVIDATGRLLDIGTRCRIPYSKTRLLVDFMTFHFRLIRRSAFEQVGGVDPFFKAASDYDLCLRLSEVTEIYHLPRPLYYYRVHPESISQGQKQKQIYFAHIAVQRALQRQGLDEKYEIIIANNSQFVLKKKA